MDNKKLSAVVLLDLSKAFDSIDHSILLQKLTNIGVSCQALTGSEVTFLEGNSMFILPHRYLIHSQ
jgi:hypothetical protein